MADPRKLKQVINNLMSNAVKFSPSHTVVRVDLSESNGPTSTVTPTPTATGRNWVRMPPRLPELMFFQHQYPHKSFE